MMRYAVVIEKADGNYSAYVPDLPGCVATGATVADVEAEIREAIQAFTPPRVAARRDPPPAGEGGLLRRRGGRWRRWPRRRRRLRARGLRLL